MLEGSLSSLTALLPRNMTALDKLSEPKPKASIKNNFPGRPFDSNPVIQLNIKADTLYFFLVNMVLF